MRKQIFVLAILSFSHLLLGAQILEGSKSQQLKDSLISDYFKNAGSQSVIYSGKISSGALLNMAIPYLKPRLEEKVAKDALYFIKGERTSYTKGRLFFDGIEYPNITMRLDLMNNELIALAPDRTGTIILDPLKVTYADLFDYKIFYLVPNKSNKLPSEGYYMQFYDGRFPIYKRYSYPGFTPLIQDFKQTITYYIYKDGVYHRINNKGSLLNVLNANKKELEQFIKENKLNFDKDKDESFASVVQHYEKLNRE